MTARVVTVLVAEDHPVYRERVVRFLEAWGLQVTAAPDGREALALLDGGLAADLLVTDLDMPHHTGWDVIDGWLRRGGRAEAIIMVTGEADDLGVQQRCAAGGIRLIHKMAFAAQFQGAVEDALAWLETTRDGAENARE